MYCTYLLIDDIDAVIYILPKLIEERACKLKRNISHIHHFPERFNPGEDMKCPRCGSATQPMEDLGARFRLKKRLLGDFPNRIHCVSCEWATDARTHIRSQIEIILKKLGIIDPESGDIDDFYRRISVEDGFVDFDALDSRMKIEEITEDNRSEYEDAIMALFYLDRQVHNDKHTHTCFKRSDLCRMHHPKKNQPTGFREFALELKCTLLSEYFNTGQCETGRVFQCNTDVQFLFSKEQLGTLIAYYVVKYVTKPQDSFAREDIHLILEKYVTRFLGIRKEKLSQSVQHNSFGEDEVEGLNTDNLNVEEPDEEREHLTEEMRKMGKSLALTMCNILKGSQELDLSMCLHYLKTKSTYWCSEDKVLFCYGYLVKKYFYNNNEEEIVLMVENNQTEQSNRYQRKDDYNAYVNRPLSQENVSFATFTQSFNMTPSCRKNIDEEDKMRPGFHHFGKKILSAKAKQAFLSFIGPSYPVHFNFERNPLEMLHPLGSFDPIIHEEFFDIGTRTDDDQEEVSVQEEEGPMGDTSDIDEDHDIGSEDNKENLDETNQEKPRSSKLHRQNLFGFLACLHFVPFRNEISTLKTDDESWWEAFGRHVESISDIDREVLTSILESQVSSSAEEKCRSFPG
jgi:hypothetical protein